MVQPGTWVTLLSGHMGDTLHGQVAAQTGDRVVRGKLQSEERSDEVAGSPEPRGAPGWPSAQRSAFHRGSSCRAVSGHMGDTAHERNDRPRTLMQHPEAKWPEVHEPQTIVDCTQSDHFAGERLADEHELAVPLHAAVLANAARLEALSVAVLGQLGRHRARRQLVDLRGRLHAERFMRPLVVVALLERVERTLLRTDRSSRWRSRLLFQGLVEPLVSPISGSASPRPKPNAAE